MTVNNTVKDEFVRKILEWWAKNKRDYPWRHKKDPYQILIAEIMLQRTRADQVVPIYIEFLRRFPTIADLASARREDVEKFFKRLGITYRAARVIKMARYIMERMNGRIPYNKEELLRIPSVGEYIANALLVFAFDRDVLAIDANVARIYSRYFGVKTRGEARRDPQIKELVANTIPQGKAKEFNWALIDFAATVCLARNPKCQKCPLKSSCKYYAQR